MIINIRGTSGSGKSHIVREVMSRCTDITPCFVEGRKRPLFYSMKLPNGQPLAIVGHYETACGGCDTIPSLDRIYGTVRLCAQAGMSVLYEGLLLSAEVNRAVALGHDPDMPELTVVALDVPVEECIDSVNQRRWAKDPNKPPVNPKNTEAKWKQTRRALERIRGAGIEGYLLSRKAALATIAFKLGYEV